MLFSYPRDATPVCATEVLELVRLQDEFQARGVDVVGLSTDSVEDHQSWVQDLERVAGPGRRVWFPLLADVDGAVARRFGMLDRVPDAEGRPTSSRAVYLVDPHLRVQFVLVSPKNTGRNFTDVLRVVDSLQVTAAQGSIGTPATWAKRGDSVVVLPTSPRGGATLSPSTLDAATSAVSSPGFGAERPPRVSSVEPAESLGLQAPPTPLSASDSDIQITSVVTPYLSFAQIKPVFPAKRARVDLDQDVA